MLFRKYGRTRLGYLVLMIAALLGITLTANALLAGGPTGPGAAQNPGVQSNRPGGAGSLAAAPVGQTSGSYTKKLPGGATLGYEVHHDTSIALRDMVPAAATQGREEGPENPLPRVRQAQSLQDTVVQDHFGAGAIPTTIANFEGINNRNGVYPPDTNGDVGPNHYMQWVNLSLQIWDKSGTSLYGPVNGNTIWQGFTGTCATKNDGDPIALYDSIADRWFIAQFTSSPPYSQCIAVSATADPTGAWHRYEFQTPNPLTDFNDYEKYGVWPDAYYMTANVFVDTGGFYPSVVAFDRTQMLLGNPATYVQVNPGNFYADLLPADLDGPTLPPAGAPNYIVSVYGTSTTIQMWKYFVDFATPANSHIDGPFNLPVAPLDPNLCGGARNCIPQPATTRRLDALGDHTMYRLAYRNFGTHESLLTNQSVDTNGQDHAGVRWYEIRGVSGSPSVYQQGTYAPDSDHRWMGSIAMDGDGNIALGYSVSSATTYPSIRYTGRMANDPLGEMTLGEGTIIAGTGSQTASGSRWGDYSMMTIDPTDDCTFWYTNEYVQTTGSTPWRTRIGSFKLPGCGAGPQPTVTPGGPTNTPQPTATNTPQATATACANYDMTQGTGTYEAATDRVDGTGCDDCTTFLPTLPMPVRLYEGTFNSAYISSNGSIQFGSSHSAFGNDCLPVPIYSYAVIPYWDDLITNCVGCGVYTAVTGTAPNRTYLVEWRTQILNSGNAPANFEVKFHEGTNAFEIVYGNIAPGTSDYTAGVQRDTAIYNQIACGITPFTQGTQYSFTQPCGDITPTPPVATSTPTVTVPVATATSGTPVATATACTITFLDVPPSHTFYPFVRCLACRGIINGYPDNTFRPDNLVTRGQLSKIVSQSAGFTEPVSGQTFEDVTPGSTFYDYVERLASRQVMGGYVCGVDPSEPCVGPENRPYFRPNAGATRGQLTKIVSNAAGFNDTIPDTQYQFTDVEPGSTFWLYVERLLLNRPGVMSGYVCGGPGEPCDSENRPYFRPNNSLTRGQTAKIVANTFFPNCQTPGR